MNTAVSAPLDTPQVAASNPIRVMVVDDAVVVRSLLSRWISETPDLDGISTLPKLLERRRDLIVIMASALTRDHAEVTLKALSLGAADYIPKPAAEGGMM